MSSQLPFTPLTPGAVERLTLDEALAFEAAACVVAGDQKPSLEVVATLVLTVQRLISGPALDAAGRSGTATGPAGRVREDAAKARTLLSGALLEELARRVLDYENAITWDTSCTSCARILDSAAEQTFRAERAEAKLAAIAEHCRKHAEHVQLHCPDLGRPAEALVKADDILAITGTGEESRDG